MPSNSRSKLVEIGQRVYAINKKALKDRYNGTRIRVGRVKTYEYRNNEVVPVVVEVGTKCEIPMEHNDFFLDINKAVDAFKPKKGRKK